MSHFHIIIDGKQLPRRIVDLMRVYVVVSVIRSDVWTKCPAFSSPCFARDRMTVDGLKSNPQRPHVHPFDEITVISCDDEHAMKDVDPETADVFASR